MKFVCSKTVLTQIVNIVQKAISAKNSYPILETIKINAEANGHISFTANSVELCIEYNTKLAVYESGMIALPSKIFGEIVRKLPDGEVTITVNPSNNITDIECEQSKFNIQGVNAEDFPNIPKVNTLYTTSMSHKDLKQIIRKVLPFISQMESRKPVLTGALFEFKNGMLNVVGTDSHRLAVIRTTAGATEEAKKFVVPGITLSKINQIITDDEEKMIKITVSDKNILFDFGNYQVYSRLLEGEFLRYEAIISVTNSIKLKADKQAIVNSLERASLIINDDMMSKTENKIPVRMNISYNKIDISCKTSKGYVNDTVAVEKEGGDLIIGLNCRFMLDALNACDDETVIMEFSAPTSGCFIKPEDGGDKYTYMILPVRLYN